MGTAETSTDQGTATPPVACALTAVGLIAQVTRWRRLAAAAMTERIETATGLELRFRGQPGVEEELRRLVAVENECCPWAAWTVRTAADEVVLEVSSCGDGIAALHGMLAGPPAAQ
jgi:hypothetical protein